MIGGISNEYRKDEKIQTEIKEARIQITELFEEIQKQRPSIDNITETFGELERCIENLSKEYERRWARTRKMVLTCFEVVVHPVIGKILAMSNLEILSLIIGPFVHEIIQRIKEEIDKMDVTLLGKFEIPVYCWKKGMGDVIFIKLFSQMQQM